MKRICIDTNIYTSFKRNDSEIVSELSKADYIGIDITVLAELYSGFKYGSKEKQNRSDLESFINTPRVEILNHNITTSEFYAKIYLDLRKKGTPIPTNDIWIASVAMQHGLELFTLDKHFKQVDGLLIKTMV